MARSRAAPSWFPQSRDDSVLDLGGVAALDLLLPAYDDMLSGVWLPLFDWTILVYIYIHLYIYRIFLDQRGLGVIYCRCHH